MGFFASFLCCGRNSNWNEESSTTRWRAFSLKELHSATNSFNYDNKLGEGVFGSVYWGQLWDGSQIVVKRLKAWNEKTEQKFEVEVEKLSKIQHKNLMNMRGFCAEGQEKLLVYDYMANMSLQSHLHGSQSKDSILDWGTRMSVSIESADAIAYLHHHDTPRMVHGDVKASNVLLDSGFRARVTDFGFSKLILGDNGKTSEGHDVYGFGILLLEIASGKKPIEKIGRGKQVAIVDWALPLAREGRFTEIVDSRLNGDFVEGELRRLVLVGLVCAHNEPEKRPDMPEVVSLLRGEMKEKFKIIENDEMFTPDIREGDISSGSSGIDEKFDDLCKEGVKDIKVV